MFGPPRGRFRKPQPAAMQCPGARRPAQRRRPTRRPDPFHHAASHAPREPMFGPPRGRFRDPQPAAMWCLGARRPAKRRRPTRRLVLVTARRATLPASPSLGRYVIAFMRQREWCSRRALIPTAYQGTPSGSGSENAPLAAEQGGNHQERAPLFHRYRYTDSSITRKAIRIPNMSHPPSRNWMAQGYRNATSMSNARKIIATR